MPHSLPRERGAVPGHWGQNPGTLPESHQAEIQSAEGDIGQDEGLCQRAKTDQDFSIRHGQHTPGTSILSGFFSP